jgi:predicted fused transcriptional regulator/phosphomethylpyrimidine kinase
MVEEAVLITENQTVTLKKAIAKALYHRQIDQLKISEILNLSQPMVSNYLSSGEKIPNELSKYAEKIADKITKGNNIRFYTSISFSDQPLKGTYYIAQKNELISEEKIKIIDNLAEAFLILKGKNLNNLIPEVKINIAMAKENPVDSNDVAAFQNGLIIVDDRISSNNGIRFGKSKHLSSLLLDLRNIIYINAIMNIAYVEDIVKTGLNVGYLTKDFKLKENKKKLDVLLHKGDFGIEPCAYVLGKDAIDVSKKILIILNGIKNEK